jgi:hypothetical protein
VARKIPGWDKCVMQSEPNPALKLTWSLYQHFIFPNTFTPLSKNRAGLTEKKKTGAQNCPPMFPGKRNKSIIPDSYTKGLTTTSLGNDIKTRAVFSFQIWSAKVY